MNLSEHIDTIVAAAPVAAAVDIDQNSSRIDMAEYEGVMFIVPVTDSVATGVAALTVEQNDADSDDGMVALDGAVATATCAVDDDLNGKSLIVDVYRPQKQYVQAVLTSKTALVGFGNVIAIRYQGRRKPVPVGATIASRITLASPDEKAA